uniref:tRNA-dihydrouridine(16/17) synthase [NAD(P)(+)] n=1 Tax=Steinernema glaseri TaxID=37863 RepID=A0A1I7YJH8_9BILA
MSDGRRVRRDEDDTSVMPENAQVASSSSVENGLLHVGRDVVLGELPSFTEEELREKKGYWRNHLKGIRKVVAPMVDQSELAFRMMMRKHGAELCFSPMVHAHLFVSDMTYRKTALSSCAGDRPLIVQFCANDVDTFLNACRLVEGFCDGVDLNLGCPQIIAKRGHYGSYLQEDRDLIRSMVEAVYKHCRLPLSVKIRRLDTIEETVEYAKMIDAAGAALLSVHGRTREMRGVNTGLADWSYIKSVKEAIEIPLIANGNIQMKGDLEKCLEETGADAVMSAEGILNNPYLFEGIHKECWVVAREYLDYAEKYDASTSAIRAHIFRICHHSLLEYTDLRERVSYVASVGEYRAIINDLEAKVTETENYKPIVWEETFPAVPGADLVEKVRASPHWMCKPYFRPSKDDSQPSDSAYREKRREEIDRLVDATGLSRRQLRKRERRRIAGQKIISHAQKKVYEKCERCNQPAGQGCSSKMCRKCCKFICSRQFKDCKMHRFKFLERAPDAVQATIVVEEKEVEETEEHQVSLPLSACGN